MRRAEFDSTCLSDRSISERHIPENATPRNKQAAIIPILECLEPVDLNMAKQNKKEKEIY